MRPLLAATFLLAFGDPAIEAWMGQAFYPSLLLLLVVASLGVPIPEDVPLIAAGVLLSTNPNIASWQGTIFVALVGIMSGDLVLYYFGKRWGPDVVNHRFVRWLVTPRRFRKATASFRRYGMWFCFFGRFLMGVRAGMCITAGVTRFRYWKFFLADFCGALITVPLWILIGYWFANNIVALEAWLTGIKGVMAAVVVAAIVAVVIYYKVRSARRQRREELEPEGADVAPAEKPRAAVAKTASQPKKRPSAAPFAKRTVSAKPQS